MKLQQQTDQAPVQASWPELSCYGCGPANKDGLHLESYASEEGEFLVATFEPEAMFNVFPGVVYGGLVASLIDCHSIWTALHFANAAEGYLANGFQNGVPSLVYVTGELKVRYLKPTPLGEPLQLKSWIEGDIGHKIHVLCELGPEGAVTAVGEVTAIRIDSPNTVTNSERSRKMTNTP